MPNSPLESAGAQVQPSASAPLHVNEFFTGMFTQGNPLGPGAVPYLYQKFYSASRFDRLLGGANVEITPSLTLKRRFGHSVQNPTPVSATRRFYFFRGYNTAGQNNRLLSDQAASVNDITGTGNVALFSKAGGAGRACFQGVGNTCYIGDGVDLKKYLLAGKSWAANTVFSDGDIIVDSNGNTQVAESRFTLNITCVQVIVIGGTYFAKVTFDRAVQWTAGVTTVHFSGLQNYTGLNTAAIVMGSNAGAFCNANQAIFPLIGTPGLYPPTVDVGTATSQVGATTNQSGNVTPTWAAGIGQYTPDGNITWRNFGNQVKPWGISPPTVPPTMTNTSALQMWRPSLLLINGGGTILFSVPILDSNNNVEFVILQAHSSYQTGAFEPTWSQITPSSTTSAGTTSDGSAVWVNGGPVRGWVANFAFYLYQCILDPNGNLQVCSSPGTTGATQPVWATVANTTTADNTATWTCLGPGVTLLTGVRQYAFAYHTISGQVSTISPMITLNPAGQAIGASGSIFSALQASIPALDDIDEIWIFATSQGLTVPLLLQRIPNPSPGSANTFLFYDEFPDAMLGITIGPQAQINNPPPAGFVPAAFHLGLVCGFINNALFYSNGPNTVTGNGNESFPPLNYFQLPSQGVAAWSTAIGLVILRVDGISIMLGSNTANSPLYVVNIFDGVGLASRDAFATRGNKIFMMTTTGKVIMLETSQFIAAIQGGTSEALPEDEIGFPIGDLLANFSPANAYVAWLEGPSSDSGLFVSDGSTGWFMMRSLKNPEQAQPWSPFASITGGVTAIAAIQTAPGVNSLLVATPSGPIWKRDQSTFADNGTSYSAFANIGTTIIAQPGSTAVVQFFVTEERLINGATPLSCAAMYDEIAGSFSSLAAITKDPPNLPPSNSVKSQRFWAAQNAAPVQVCRFFQQQVAWPAQNFGNELLTNTTFGKLPEKARR